mgnify:CR=1 FL=1
MTARVGEFGVCGTPLDHELSPSGGAIAIKGNSLIEFLEDGAISVDHKGFMEALIRYER